MPTVEEGVGKISAARACIRQTHMGDARVAAGSDTLSLRLLSYGLKWRDLRRPTVGDFYVKIKKGYWGRMQALNLPDFNVFRSYGAVVSYYQYYDNPF